MTSHDDADRQSEQFDQFDQDDALRAVIAGSDPARSLTPADPAALTSLLEDVMSTDLEARSAPDATAGAGAAGRRTRATWLVAAAAAVAIVGIGGYAVSHVGSDQPATPSAGPSAGTSPITSTPPTPGDSGLPAPGTTTLSTAVFQGRCAAPTADFIAAQQQAFSATVTSVEAGAVTLTTSEVYAGQVGQTVVVQAPSAELRALIQAAHFQVGGTYLVAATDGMVAPCGLTGKATGDLQSMYEKAFTQ